MLTERISTTIEQAESLDGPADAIAGFVHRLLPAGRLTSVLSGTPLGHPAHPMLVSVPIGAWVSSVVLDLFGGESGRRSARRLAGFGALAAVPTALTGLSDWSDTLGAERRVGLVHAATNDVALILFGSSWNARRRGKHRAGRRLALLGSVALGAGGWLGGHLAYAIGVGVDTNAYLSGPSEWTDVANEVDLDEGRPVFTIAGTVPILLLRRGSSIVAMSDRCTHRGAPLHEGSIVDGCIQCPWHDSRFRLSDGQVARGPATRPQPMFEARVLDGRVQIRRAAEQRALRANPVDAA